MTQLYIAGTEVALPQNFSVSVKRENPFFTKSGEYTYDATINLNNTVNRQLYGFLHRLNKREQLQTKRTAVLIADGRVYMRGTEIITRWTHNSVSIQIVSGESELNSIIGEDILIEDLDMGFVECYVTEDPVALRPRGGSYPAYDCCFPTIRMPDGYIVNAYTYDAPGAQDKLDVGRTLEETMAKCFAQPYLCALIRRMFTAIGYSIGTNELEGTPFAHLFITNTACTFEYAKMLPGWTVGDFIKEVEKLTGVVFLIDNSSHTVDIRIRGTYFQNAKVINLQNVIDAYEVNTDDSSSDDWSRSNIRYNFPSHRYTNFMRLPEGLLNRMQTGFVTNNLYNTLTNGVVYDNRLILDSSDGIMYSLKRGITSKDLYAHYWWGDWQITKKYRPQLLVAYPIDLYADINRNSESDIELDITPAPMMFLGQYGWEVIDLGEDDPIIDALEESDYEPEDVDGEEDDEQTTDEIISGGGNNGSSQQCDLYAAFHYGEGFDWDMPIVYTDKDQSFKFPETVVFKTWDRENREGFHWKTERIERPANYLPDGSLRLTSLDRDYYQGGYDIDTQHAYTIECYDPNMIDVRQIYVIGNRRFVCRDVEETITATGRTRKWKGTFYPIRLSDTAADKDWVLTRGVWDDGGAWLDDGRWNDNPR